MMNPQEKSEMEDMRVSVRNILRKVGRAGYPIGQRE